MVKQQLEQAEKSTEKGAEMGGGIMKGSAGYMQTQGKKAMAGEPTGWAALGGGGGGGGGAGGGAGGGPGGGPGGGGAGGGAGNVAF